MVLQLVFSGLMQVITIHVRAPGMTLPVCLGPQLGKWNGFSSSTRSLSLHCGLILKEGQTGLLEMWQSPDSKSVKVKASCLPQALALESSSISFTRRYRSKQAMRSAQTQRVGQGLSLLHGRSSKTLDWVFQSIHPIYPVQPINVISPGQYTIQVSLHLPLLKMVYSISGPSL